MGHEIFITDYVNIYNQNGELLYSKVGSYGDLSKGKWIIAYKSDKVIEEGFFFIKEINDKIKEKYIIEDVQYNSHPRINTANNITLQVYKEGKRKQNLDFPMHTVVNNIQNNHGNVAGINNGTQNMTQITNDIDSIIRLLQESDITNKIEIIDQFNRLKEKPNNKDTLRKTISLLANTGAISSTIVIPIMNFLVTLI